MVGKKGTAKLDLAAQKALADLVRLLARQAAHAHCAEVLADPSSPNPPKKDSALLMKSAPRIVLYGRHSTSLQTVTSSEDQTASCMKLVDYLNGTVVATFLDPEVSGYKRNRPGLKQLLRLIENGEADMVVCESLDRLARDAEDVAWLGKKLPFHSVQLHTVTEGHIDEVKFGVAALMGTIFLKNLTDKTLRGMEAAVLAGRIAGGRSYGYDTRKIYDKDGERIRSYLDITPAKASVVQRIFRDFASGLSAYDIAKALNEEGVPSPRGQQWNASTIRGDPKSSRASSTTRSM
ncbi:recombinase family protein [Sphingobium yanoikuyae]|uniref:Recombinase family protein n=1 Tax=Sphingobium yanoikuyae TaxID=13690 RepID=A0A430BBS8_SPHYA|nr:recombinase family protein [Sphingobium yanoikuyae]RSU45939.1 recombinase family protein [Sphingobium yanoikuyae]